MSVLSIDGNKTWSTKLERVSRRSVSDKLCVFNNLGHIIDYDMLKELYYTLDGTKAIGVDKITKEQYGQDLIEHLTSLLDRIRRGTYKPQPARITEIPKEDGSKRPLAISCLEDKLVQMAVNQVLNSIYEPIFLQSSYGFRPNRSCHDALRALKTETYRLGIGAVVEIDIKKYFNRIPHKEIMHFLSLKIADRRFLKLIHTLISMPTIEGKVITLNAIGCPQGSIVSPVLANIYLHYVIDEWFESVSRSHIKGRTALVRYADDMVFVFGQLSEAQRFYKTLPKRLEKFGLEMHLDKSSIIPAGHAAALMAKKQGKRLPTFKFLGFTCYWGKSRKGYWILRFTSRGDRFKEKLRGMKKFLWKNLNTPDTEKTIRTVRRVIVGWVNYHLISFNERRVSSFLLISKRILFKWFNRRGSKKMNWTKFAMIMNQCHFPRRRDFKSTSMF